MHSRGAARTQGASRVPEPVEVPASGSLPAYTVRVSARARRVRLTVSARDGLVVTLPRGLAAREAARAVAARREWALAHLAAVSSRRAALTAPPEARLPETIVLRALSARYAVEYRESASGGAVRVRASGATLHVGGSASDPEARLAALRRWRDRTARSALAALLRECSSATGIAYARLSVRGQRTRWGSCSASGTISLHRNLVFLPPELARYVVLHELAHVAERGHGERFWRHLASLEPDARALRARMRDAGEFVPAWADE